MHKLFSDCGKCSERLGDGKALLRRWHLGRGLQDKKVAVFWSNIQAKYSGYDSKPEFSNLVTHENQLTYFKKFWCLGPNAGQQFSGGGVDWYCFSFFHFSFSFFFFLKSGLRNNVLESRHFYISMNRSLQRLEGIGLWVKPSYKVLEWCGAFFV